MARMDGSTYGTYRLVDQADEALVEADQRAQDRRLRSALDAYAPDPDPKQCAAPLCERRGLLSFRETPLCPTHWKRAYDLMQVGVVA